MLHTSSNRGTPVSNDITKIVRQHYKPPSGKIGHVFFIFCFTDFFHNKLALVRVGGQNKNKIHSDHFPIELKLKETQFRVSFDFNSNGKLSE